MRLKRIQVSPFVIQLGSIVVVLGFWELTGRWNPLFTSYPSAIARAAVDLLMLDTELPRAFATTLWALAAGYAIAVVIGISLGMAMARIRTVGIALDPYIVGLYTTPSITIIPLLVLWVGIDFKLRLTIVIISAAFPIIINVRDGAREADRDFIDVARSLAATRWQVLRTVVLPGSLPYLFVALRLGVRSAIIGVIVAESTAALAGTGKQLFDYARSFRTDRLMVTILVIGFFSIFVTWLLKKLQAAVSPWESARQGAK